MSDTQKIIENFSRFDRSQKIQALTGLLKEHPDDMQWLEQLWVPHMAKNSNSESISENVISHFFLPYSIAPNFRINDNLYFIPMVTEESSVVAAASAAAKFWLHKGGFHTTVIATTKVGQIHFTWPGKFQHLKSFLPNLKEKLLAGVGYHIRNMVGRGGGVKDIELLDYTSQLQDYYQIRVLFETADAMGANLINSCLEEMAKVLQHFISENFEGDEKMCKIIMSILSNYTPECLVECSVQCKTEHFKAIASDLTTMEFADKFKLAVDIADIDIYRATTHNKGIFNGIDAVVIATGNDYRAVEAGGHSYASNDGKYKSLTHIELKNDIFTYTLRMPLSIGTVGGLTSIHPLARLSLRILKDPTAPELMQIAAVAGLANNFSAIRALITSGIQKVAFKQYIKFHKSE
jgi:hydroxymethylglutaryl-CoA reductase